MNTDNKKRILWIDVAKAIGMFFIYLGHFGEHAGLAYKWVFSFHVSLFFFLSGCLESKNDTRIIERTIHRFISIMIPYFLIGFIMIIYEVIDKESYEYIIPHLIILLKGGIRNSLYLEAGLWFLSCLFVLQTIFTILRKVLKHKLLILFVCIVFNYVLRAKIGEPSWYYNLDSALKYMLYYCVGWIGFDFLNKLLEDKRKKYKIIKYIIFIVTVAFSGTVYFDKHIFIKAFGTSKFVLLSEGIITSLISIYLVVFISYILKENKLLQNIGQNSLYLCGCEYLIKQIMLLMISILGFNIIIDDAKQAIIYSIILLVVSNYSIVPYVKMLICSIQADFKTLIKKR